MATFDYQGKRVIVTGASSGIGEATAQALIGLGAEVHGVARKEPQLELASFQRLDLTDPDSITSGIAAIGGHVDALFNCAGAVPTIPAPDILKVNFLGTRLLTEQVVPLMSDGGAIVNVSSDAGYGWRKSRPVLLEFLSVGSFDGGADWFELNKDRVGHAYTFGKEALNVWTMQQSAVLIQQGIRINTSSPGAVQTPMLEAIEAAFPVELITATEQPIGRRSTPQEQVEVLLFLNSSIASYINGADIAIDGGYWASLNLTGSLWN